MSGTRLRKGRPEDAVPLERMERALYESDIEEAADWRAHMAEARQEVWVLADDKGLVGSLLLVDVRTNLRIEGIAVAKRGQGRGLAKRLMAHAEKRARARGKRRLTLEVRPENQRAQTVYRAAGFRRIGTRPDFYEDGKSAIRMAKRVA